MAQTVRSCVGVLILPAMLVALANLSPARAEAPLIGNLAWEPGAAYCVFARAGETDSEPAAGALFVTELVSDDLTSVERGYMRIDGLLRELQLLDRKVADQVESRNYRTFGGDPVEIGLTLSQGASDKSQQGQVVFVRYTGMLTAARGTSLRQVAVTGSCGEAPPASPATD